MNLNVNTKKNWAKNLKAEISGQKFRCKFFSVEFFASEIFIVKISGSRNFFGRMF